VAVGIRMFWLWSHVFHCGKTGPNGISTSSHRLPAPRGRTLFKQASMNTNTPRTTPPTVHGPTFFKGLKPDHASDWIVILNAPLLWDLSQHRLPCRPIASPPAGQSSVSNKAMYLEIDGNSTVTTDIARVALADPRGKKRLKMLLYARTATRL
jgi:hypothetical protein